jgi:ornithine cyclodeaminase
MKTLILTRSQVHRLLPVRECIDIMADALRELGQGRMILPLRQVVPLTDRSGLLGLMPAISEDSARMAAKIISVFPQNRQQGLESHQGVVLLFDAKQGHLLAIAEAGSVTAIRTAAVSGLATQLLARSDARQLAILGSGLEAQMHLEAMMAVRKIEHVRVWSRTLSNAETFARIESDRHQICIDVATSARGAVAKADVICTVTASNSPVLEADWIAPGTHINAVGACTPNARELDSRTVASARLFVDRRESTLKESGDFLIPKQEGLINDDHILGELGDLLLGRTTGRTSSKDLTVFKSLGIAIEDLAAANLLYNKATATGDGTWLDLEN